MPWEKRFDVDAALGRAMEAFWAKGYAATSTQDLLDRMGINRGSLYDTFGNKRSLFLQALRRYEASYRRPRIAAVTQGRGPRAAIAALFRSLVSDALEDTGRTGCFLVNTALEQAPYDEEIADVVGTGFQEIEDFFRTTIERGQETGEISGTLDATEVARALLGLMIGMRVLARSTPDRALLESIAAQAVAMLG